MQADNNLVQFFEECRGLSKEETSKRVIGKRKYDSYDWVRVSSWCHHDRRLFNFPKSERLYHLEVAALKRAVEIATTLADWIRIAEYTKDKAREYRRKAFCEIRKFNITSGEDIMLLRNSSSIILRSIGWYLDGKREKSSKDEKPKPYVKYSHVHITAEELAPSKKRRHK